jgi:hypothetical protein
MSQGHRATCWAGNAVVRWSKSPLSLLQCRHQQHQVLLPIPKGQQQPSAQVRQTHCVLVAGTREHTVAYCIATAAVLLPAALDHAHLSHPTIRIQHDDKNSTGESGHQRWAWMEDRWTGGASQKSSQVKNQVRRGGDMSRGKAVRERVVSSKLHQFMLPYFGEGEGALWCRSRSLAARAKLLAVHFRAR